MTEAEALTKLCCGPPAMAVARYYASGADVVTPMLCVGSACQAWRVREQWQAMNGEWLYGQMPSGLTDPQPAVREVGYCGLAGLPS